jgi:hypothetical protein
MTEERARYYAKALARSMGVTFYAVRSHEDRYMACRSRRTTARSSRR